MCFASRNIEIQMCVEALPTVRLHLCDFISQNCDATSGVSASRV